MKTIGWFGLVLGALSAAGDVILTKPGQSATFKCGLDTNNRGLVWNYGNDQVISVDGRSGVTHRGTKFNKRSVLRGTSLVVSGVTEEDVGKYFCMADGRSKEHTLLVVSVSVSPSSELQLGTDATLQCWVKGLNPPDSPVQWNRPDGRSESETVQLKSVARSDAGNWECTFSHDGKKYSESLEIKVQGAVPVTAAPSPSPSSKAVSIAQPPATDAVLLGLSWWVWVAIGVGGLVMVLLMVFVIVLYKRIKRRKRKFLNKKNGRQPLKPKTYCQCDRPAAAAKPQQGRRKAKPSALPLQPLLMA
ncbi:hypothetical protein EPR50_G00062780 [Perca flavescens]|uniref:Ig-like domain-containing protein n=1 Tax=Perca flavescens TaxID=8167 RepID=A0A484DAM6_PERFV|nr:hypothetical protein EPR50_G00062780 [Perca flavescens]